MPNSTERSASTTPSSRLLITAALTLLAALSQSRATLAQQPWSTPDASGNIHSTNTGGVGVGTSTPASALEVQGADGPITLSQAGVPSKSTVQAALGTDLHLSANAKYAGGAWGRYDTSLPSWNFFLSPTADYLGIRRTAGGAGSINWVEMFRITNSGNVGIGTPGPGYPLHVQNNTGSPTALAAVNSSGEGVYLLNTNPTVAFNNVWNGSAHVATVGGHYGFRMEEVNGTVNFYTSSNAPAAGGAYAYNMAMALDSAGNVGIGTTSPGYKLQVVTASQTANGAGLWASDNHFLALHPSAGQGSHNGLTQAGDSSIIYGIGTMEPGGALVIAPWANATSGIRMDAGGNVGIGVINPQAALDVHGSITVSGNINAKFQDVAEWVPSTKLLSAGTVVVLDASHNNQVTTSSKAYDTRVAGVVSAQPGIALGESGDGKVLVATTGRVKVKVDATKSPIRIGDLLVTGDTPGVAMKSVPVDLGGVQIHRPGTIIGKALEPLDKGTGEILVLLSLQ